MHSRALQDRLRSQTHAFQNARMTDYGSLNKNGPNKIYRLEYLVIREWWLLERTRRGLVGASGEAEGHAFETRRFQPLRF